MADDSIVAPATAALGAEEVQALLVQPWLPCTQMRSISEHLREKQFGPIFSCLLPAWIELGEPNLQTIQALGQHADRDALDLRQLCQQQEESIARTISDCIHPTFPVHIPKSRQVFISQVNIFCLIKSELDCLKQGVQVHNSSIFYCNNLTEHLTAFDRARMHCKGLPNHLCIGQLTWGEALHLSLDKLLSMAMSLITDLQSFSPKPVDVIAKSLPVASIEGLFESTPTQDGRKGAVEDCHQPYAHSANVAPNTITNEDRDRQETAKEIPSKIAKDEDNKNDDDDEEYETSYSEAPFSPPLGERKRRPAIVQLYSHGVAMFMALSRSASRKTDSERLGATQQRGTSKLEAVDNDEDESLKEWFRTVDLTVEKSSFGQSFGTDQPSFSSIAPSASSADDITLYPELEETSAEFGADPNGVPSATMARSVSDSLLAVHLAPPAGSKATSRPGFHRRGASSQSIASSIGSNGADAQGKGKHKEVRRIQSLEQYGRSREQRNALRMIIGQLQEEIQQAQLLGLHATPIGKRFSEVFLAERWNARDRESAGEEASLAQRHDQADANERKRKSKRKLRQDDERNISIVSDLAGITLELINQASEATYLSPEATGHAKLLERLLAFWGRQQQHMGQIVQAERRLLVKGKMAASTFGAIEELEIRLQTLGFK